MVLTVKKTVVLMATVHVKLRVLVVGAVHE